MRKRVKQEFAFLNIPYDRRYESIYLAFIAGLCAFGLTPRATIVEVVVGTLSRAL